MRNAKSLQAPPLLAFSGFLVDSILTKIWLNVAKIWFVLQIYGAIHRLNFCKFMVIPTFPGRLLHNKLLQQ